jgi:rhodanese-related sulfurtransferase
MQTNFEDIYACGDCAESYSLITGKPIYRPLGSTANKTGRIVGDQITGNPLEFRGILGTAIFRAFELTVAQTGLSEKEALAEGYDVETCYNIKYDKPEYMHGKEMLIKAVADRNTGRMLGAQIIGKSGVDKRIDVFATAITFGAKAEDLFHLDLAYAPPYSTAKDPVMYTGMILDNALNRNRRLISPAELQRKIENGDDLQIIDARSNHQFSQSHVKGAENIALEKMREAVDSLDGDKPIVCYCNRGVTSNAVQNILINKGFEKTYNLSGGYSNLKMCYGSVCVDKDTKAAETGGIDISEKDTSIKDVINKNQ